MDRLTALAVALRAHVPDTREDYETNRGIETTLHVIADVIDQLATETKEEQAAS